MILCNNALVPCLFLKVILDERVLASSSRKSFPLLELSLCNEGVVELGI